jgi:WD40 repeat protein
VFRQDLKFGVGTGTTDERLSWIVNAMPGQICKVQFQVPDFADSGDAQNGRDKLKTGFLTFTATENETDPADVSRSEAQAGPAKPRLELVRSYEHTHGSASLAFTNNDQQVLLAGEVAHPYLTLYDLAEEKTVRRFSRTTAAFFLNISSDGQFAASAGLDGTVELWSLEQEDPIDNFESHMQALTVDFAPDGSKLAVGGLGTFLYIFDPNNFGEVIRRNGHFGGCVEVKYFPDGERIVSVGFDRTARIWRRDLRGQLLAIDHPDNVWSVDVSPDGTRILTGTGGRVLGQVADQKYEQGVDNKVRLWNATTGELIREMEGHAHLVRAVKFSPNGRYAASASYDKTVRLWDLKTGKELDRNEGSSWMYTLAFSPDGQNLLVSGGVIHHGNDYWTGSERERLRMFRIVDPTSTKD